MRRLRFNAGFWVLATALFVSACAKTPDKRLSSKGNGVVVGLLSEPKTLNPLVATDAQTYDIIDLVFLKLLVEQGDFLTFKPRLAERWSFSDDSLSIVFALRQDVFWHDGEPVTAEDVRFTWQLQTDPRVAWSGRSFKDRITDVEVIDRYRVVFHFKERYLYQLHDANDGVILPVHILGGIPIESLRSSDFGRHPVGCGPFKFERWVPGQYLELARNPDYYVAGEPFLDRIGFRIVPDMTNLVTQLKAGEIDCLESLPVDAIPDILADYPEIRIHHYPSRDMAFVVWNLENDLFESRELRRALAMAIDSGEIIETLWHGMADVSLGPMHPLLWAYDPDMKAIPYDPARARATLAALGWVDSDNDGIVDRDGRPLEFEMTTNQGIQVRADVITMVQEYLRRVGVKVNARVLEWNTFMDGVQTGDFDSCVLGWRVGTRADLTDFWHSSATPPNGFNASRYDNPHVDALIENARSTVDIESAKMLWHECQREIYEDQPIFFLAIPHKVVALRKRFCGVEPNAYSFFVNVAEWYVSDECSSTGE